MEKVNEIIFEYKKNNEIQIMFENNRNLSEVIKDDLNTYAVP